MRLIQAVLDPAVSAPGTPHRPASLVSSIGVGSSATAARPHVAPSFAGLVTAPRDVDGFNTEDRAKIVEVNRQHEAAILPLSTNLITALQTERDGPGTAAAKVTNSRTLNTNYHLAVTVCY